MHRVVSRDWMLASYKFFFFQAEDGIRARDVTGVQTCALPILPVMFLNLSRQGIEITGTRMSGERLQIGRASCRERVEIAVEVVALKKKKGNNVCNCVAHRSTRA